MVIDVLVCRPDGRQTVESRTVADDYLDVTEPAATDELADLKSRIGALEQSSAAMRGMLTEIGTISRGVVTA